MNNFEEFINTSFTYLIVGVSRETTKWGYRVWKTLNAYGYKVIPINPKHEEIEGERCFRTVAGGLQATGDKQQAVVVITVVPPAVTEKIVEECVELEITKIWMQPGSEIENIKSQIANLKIVKDKCIVRNGLGKPFTV